MSPPLFLKVFIPPGKARSFVIVCLSLPLPLMVSCKLMYQVVTTSRFHSAFPSSTYAETISLRINTQLSSGAECINFCWAIIYVPIICLQAVKALAALDLCRLLCEHLLLGYMLSIKMACADSNMGLVARKPVFGVSDKSKQKPVSSATQTS